MIANSDLAGIPVATLQQYLADAQKAVHDLSIGGKPVTMRVGAGDLSREVTFTQANIGGLHAYIAEIKAELARNGVPGYRGRRPLAPFF